VGLAQLIEFDHRPVRSFGRGAVIRLARRELFIMVAAVMRIKRVSRWLFELYVFGNVHIACCALALTLTTQSLLGLKLRPELLTFIFCATLFGYNLQRLPSNQAVPRCFARHFWNTQHRFLLITLTILAAAAFMGSFARLYLRSQVMAMLPAALSFAYAIPIIPAGRKRLELREIPGLKIFIIAITWAFSCALLPVASVHRAGQPWFPAAAIVWAVACGLMIFSITVPFDIRDLRFDAQRLKAVPAVLGVRNSIRIALAALILSNVLVWTNCVGSPAQAVGYSLWSVVAGLFIRKSSPERSEYYFSFWIDGLLLLLCVMIGWIGPR
jgi:hypothetical protein